MPIRRRFLLAAAGSAFALPALAQGAPPPAAETGDRAIGKPDAPVTVQEFFSLTCTHCAAFAKEVFPEVKAKLIDTGKLRYVFRDFPLDQVALMAAMVARALPPDRYEPFVIALLGTQDRWAFARGVDSKAELGKMAALAGLPHSDFEAVVADAKLKASILAAQDAAQKKYAVDSTPTFVFDGPKAQANKQAGEMTYDAFAAAVTAAA